MATKPILIALFTVPAIAIASPAASSAASQIPPARVGSINNDAMTMQQCRDRLSLPKNARPKDDDPRVDLDAVCTNLLHSSASPPSRAASPASR
jgi:hypothetical protein